MNVLYAAYMHMYMYRSYVYTHAHTHIYIYTDTPRLNITHAGSEHTCEFAVYCTHSWAHSLCMRVRARVRLYVW
jgi:hypothetical protein